MLNMKWKIKVEVITNITIKIMQGQVLNLILSRSYIASIDLTKEHSLSSNKPLSILTQR